MTTLKINGKLRPDATLNNVVWAMDSRDNKLVVGVDSLDLTVPAEAASDLGRLLFQDDFTTLKDLNGFNTQQVTSGASVRLVQGSYLECSAPIGAKAEIGHDWPLAEGIKEGQVWTFKGSLLVAQGGPSELFLVDCESTGTASEPGPRLRNKNGGWGIELDKVGGVNIQPASPPLTPFVNSVRYDIEWQSLAHQSQGWCKLKVNGVQVFDTTSKPTRTMPATPLNRFRFGATINSSSAPATVRFYNAAAWVK